MSLASALLVSNESIPYPPDTQPHLPAGFLTARREERLLALLLDVIDTQGLLSSAVTSVLNLMTAQLDADVSLDAIVVYLPAEPQQSLALGRQLIDSELSSDCLAQLQECSARLAIARAMTLSFYRYPAKVHHKGGVHIEVLSGVWRDLCEQTVVLIDALRLAMPDTSRPPLSALRSVSPLSSCANGGAPCVMDDGTIEIKGWVERRRNARWMVDWPVILLDGPTTVPAQITNISLGGFGLFAPAAELHPYEHICVAFHTGQRLTGEVVWARAGHHGIQFATPLDPTDPLVATAKADNAKI